MNTRSQPTRTWTCSRAFLLTIGVVIFVLIFVVWVAQGDASNEWPLFAWCLLGAFIFGGLTLCGYAIRGLDSSITNTFNNMGKNEAEVVIFLLAGPVYWIGNVFKKTKNDS